MIKAGQGWAEVMAACLWVGVMAGGEPAAAGKLIATGWDSPDTAQFRQDIRLMEELPFAGYVIYARGVDATGKSFDSKRCFDTNRWEKSFFAAAAADLGAARSATITDNFLALWANPGGVDWFDDAGWAAITEHWRILAALARQGGLKGLVFDPEPYTAPWSQFNYQAQPGQSHHTYGEYCLKARERGRQVMAAAAAEFPGMVVFTYRLLGECAREVGNGSDPTIAPESAVYGLLPGFVDGWLDVVPPTVSIVDGDEASYGYNNQALFDRDYVWIKTAGRALVSAQNQAKYKSQLSVSHGIYLDAYANPPGSQYYIDGQGESRVNRLCQNVASALQAADDYVWVYGEQARWWPPPGSEKTARPVWDKLLPGAESALWQAVAPVVWAQRELARVGTDRGVTNLLADGRFDDYTSVGISPVEWARRKVVAWQTGAPTNSQPASIVPARHLDWQPKVWKPWQDWQKSYGDLYYDPETGAAGKGSACLSGVRNGGFVQAVAVAPGEQMIVSVKVRQAGAGRPYLNVRWQTDRKIWTDLDQDAAWGVPETASALAWREIIGVVSVPADARRLVVILGVSGQNFPEDRVWFDDAVVIAAGR